MSMKKKNAFSLAEIVVTIAVIGVIAAITVPSLQADARKRSQAAQIKKVYSELNQAVTLLVADTGTEKISRSSAFTSEEKFEEMFVKKYFNVSKVCPKGDSKECFSENISVVSSNNKSYLLDNGVALQFRGSYPLSTIATQRQIIVDINGANKPNKSGRDVFLLSLDLKKANVSSFYPLDTPIFKNIKCTKAMQDNVSDFSTMLCTHRLMLDNWEMKY